MLFKSYASQVPRKGGNNDLQKRSLLLHVAGMEVQEVYLGRTVYLLDVEPRYLK